MRINLWNTPIPEATGSEKASRSGSTPRTSSTESPGAAEDQTRLSFDSLRIQALETEVQKMPDLREEKIAAIRQALADGSYGRESEQVAAAMLDEIAARSRLVR